MKQLIVNADDFGYTDGVNRGIIEACEKGIVTATTLMAVGPAFAGAVKLATTVPKLDVGVHIVLAGDFAPLSAVELLPQLTNNGRFHRSALTALYGCWRTPASLVRTEIQAQVKKVIAAGINPSHIDCHKHLHTFPFLWRIFIDVAREFSIPFIRRPGDTFIVPLEYPPTLAIYDSCMRWLAEIANNATPHRSLRHFYGQRAVGHMEKIGLLECLRCMPEGTTELMVHPGNSDELLQRTSRLTISREIELRALCDPEVCRAVTACGIKLCSFSALIEGHER